MLQFSSASNEIVDSRLAMQDCIQRALSGLEGGKCDLLVLHVTIAHDFKAMLETAKELCPGAQIAGCTCAGVIGREGASEKMRAMAVMAVKGDASDFAVGYRDNIRGFNSFEVAKDIAAELKASHPAISMINILASGIDIAADRAIEGVEAVFGTGFPIFGGTSSDNNKAKSNFQFVGDRIMERAAILIGFADPTLDVRMGVHHGNNAIGMPYEVTRSEANRIFELNGKTAYPLLMDQLGLAHDTDLSNSIALACLGEPVPEGLEAVYDNAHLPRVITSLDEKKESIYLPVSCPVGTKLWLMARDEKLIFEGLDRMLAKLVTQLEGRRTVAVFHTDCSARGRLMFNKVLKDEIVSRMQNPFGGETGVPWLGLYGFGEFTQIEGRNFFHNQTTSIYALTRKA